MNYSEKPVVFPCDTDFLIGVLSLPNEFSGVGVIIVVGGPQYRAGTHRQFVQLARALAHNGAAVLRFDYRGMGDSGGAMRSFETIEDDIRSAVDAFMAHVPEVRQLNLFGLCDGASAACFYAAQDPRISGLILANPWVRTEAIEAKALVKHYYLRRLFARDLWAKACKGQIGFIESARHFLRSLVQSTARKSSVSAGNEKALPDRIGISLSRFRGRLLILLSGNDLTAAEFADVMDSSTMWRHIVQRGEVARFPQADHTFSRQDWSRQMEGDVSRWLGIHDRTKPQSNLAERSPPSAIRTT